MNWITGEAGSSCGCGFVRSPLLVRVVGVGNLKLAVAGLWTMVNKAPGKRR